MLRKVYYTAWQLENIANDLLKRYAPETIDVEPVPTPIERMIEIDCGLYMCYMNLSKRGKTPLGKTCFDDGYTRVYNRQKKKMEYIKVDRGTIIIEADLLHGNPGRLRFSQCHEFSHWTTQKEIYTGTNIQPAFRKQEPDPEEKWLEWQADEISRNLLLPMKTVRPYFNILKNKRGLSDFDIITEIAGKYIVSKQTAGIQLHEHKLIKMDRRSLYLN